MIISGLLLAVEAVRGRPVASRTSMEMTGALCFSWISFPRMAVAFWLFRFSSSSATERRKTKICPLFVPAHRVGLRVWAKDSRYSLALYSMVL